MPDNTTRQNELPPETDRSNEGLVPPHTSDEQLYQPSLDDDDVEAIFTPIQNAYDPAKDREGVRGMVAQALVLLLAVLCILPFIGAFAGAKTQDLKMVLELVLTPVVGLVGAVTGFYFGEKSK